MKDKQTGVSLTAWLRRAACMNVAVALLAISGSGADAQPFPTMSLVNKQKQGVQMKQFVFIFRQSKRVLSQEQLEQRRAWALSLRKEGRNLDPRILGEESYRVTLDNDKRPTPPSGEDPVAAILFLEAADFSEAVKIAKTHPGLHFGLNIEVREWSTPPTPPSTDQPGR
jgi:hypothetical protein